MTVASALNDLMERNRRVQFDTLATFRAHITVQAKQNYPDADILHAQAQTICQQLTDYTHAMQSIILTLTLAQATQ